MKFDPDPRLDEPLADLMKIAELLWHPCLAQLQSWDGGLFYEMALFIDKYNATVDPDAMETILHRFDSAEHRARRAQALRRGRAEGRRDKS